MGHLRFSWPLLFPSCDHFATLDPEKVLWGRLWSLSSPEVLNGPGNTQRHKKLTPCEAKKFSYNTLHLKRIKEHIDSGQILWKT